MSEVDTGRRVRIPVSNTVLKRRKFSPSSATKKHRPNLYDVHGITNSNCTSAVSSNPPPIWTPSRLATSKSSWATHTTPYSRSLFQLGVRRALLRSQPVVQPRYYALPGFASRRDWFVDAVWTKEACGKKGIRSLMAVLCKVEVGCICFRWWSPTCPNDQDMPKTCQRNSARPVLLQHEPFHSSIAQLGGGTLHFPVL